MSFWDSYNAAAQASSQGFNVLGDAMRQFKQRQTGQQVAQALQAGDYSKAGDAFAQAGDIENVQRVRQMQQASAAEQQTKAKEYLLNGAKALLQVPAEQRQAVYQSQVRPALEQFGAPPELLAQIDGADKSDQSLQTFVTALGGQAAREKLEFRQAGQDVFALDPYTGEQVAKYSGTPQPRWMERANPDGSTSLVDVNQYRQAGQGEDPLVRIASLAPDATVTSGYRTPEHNEEVGGVANSYHTRGTGQAVDLKPRPGETTAQLAKRLRGQGFAEVIDEKDHVHVAWDQPVGAGSGVGIQWDAPDGKAARADAKEAAREQQTIKRDEGSLRQQFNGLPEVKAFREVQASYGVINSLAGKAKPTAADDLSLIFAYMKMLDPGSTVREGEFANAQNAAGIPDRVVNAYNRAASGNLLNPKQRQEFAQGARSIFATRLDQYNQRATDYRGYAEDYGASPDRVARLATAPTTSRKTEGAQAYTPAQRRSMQGFGGKKDPATGDYYAGGDRNNPFVPTTNAEFDAMKPGSWYIDTDGKILRK